MYNKLCNRQDGFFSNRSYLQKNKDHQMKIKKHTNYFISLNHVYFVASF